MTKQEAQEIINRLNSNRNIEMPLCLLKSACETIVKQDGAIEALRKSCLEMCETIEKNCDHLVEEHERVLKLEKALQNIINNIPCMIDGDLFYEHFDQDGNYIGSENVNPLDIIGQAHHIAREALGEEK